MAAYWEIAAHSAFDMFSKYLSKFSFSRLGFWSGNFFLIALFPDHCIFVPVYCMGKFSKCVESSQFDNIRKTCPCNEYPIKPHFYIVKLGYAGVYLFFLFLLQNIDCGYSLEPPLCFEQK